MEKHPESDLSAISSLAEPNRAAIFEFVRGRAEPVSRDDVAAALGLPRQTAAFHLDRLADEGLLAVEFARRGDRTGPGAGRPSKLYRRSDREIAVQIPPRSYDLAAELLAHAIQESESSGDAPRRTLLRGAREYGHRLGADAAPTDDGILDVLARCGYDPRHAEDAITLFNCPFHRLVQHHVELVCGMNLELLQGLLSGAGCTHKRAVLSPAPGLCCVRIETARA